MCSFADQNVPYSQSHKQTRTGTSECKLTQKTDTNKHTEKHLLCYLQKTTMHNHIAVEIYRLWNVSLCHALPRRPSFATRLSTPFDLRPEGLAVTHRKKHRISRKVQHVDLQVHVQYCRLECPILPITQAITQANEHRHIGRQTSTNKQKPQG